MRRETTSPFTDVAKEGVEGVAGPPPLTQKHEHMDNDSSSSRLVSKSNWDACL
jgi:hypothetical protein